jgi:16S rRNA (adenine1518-N6/adenine1519-N6)-dimethyltransferase
MIKTSHITLKRHRGQHLLHDANILKKIIDAAHIDSGETIVEIGPGTGNLTLLLASRARSVIAVEIDRDLVRILRERIIGVPNIQIIQDDARTVPNATFGAKDGAYSVVANIPYNITSMLVRKFLEERPRPARMILLMQKEVARRLCARPPHMSILALSVQYYAVPRILFPVSRNSFSPKPHVDSACVEIVVSPDIPPTNEQEIFFRLVTAGFSSKRKLLASNLSLAFGQSRERVLDAFCAAGIPSGSRAQELSLSAWRALCAYFIT